MQLKQQMPRLAKSPLAEKKNTVIRIPILNDEYKVIVCWGSDKFCTSVGKKYHYKNTKVTLFEDNRGMTWKERGNFPIIVIHGYPKQPWEFGTLAHEAYHAVKYIMRDIGETEADEFIGHSIGVIVRMVLAEAKP